MMFKIKVMFVVLLVNISACNLTAPETTPEVLVPPTVEAALEQPVVFFVVSEEERIEVRRVGCDSFIVPRTTGVNRVNDEAANIRVALEGLLTMSTADINQEGQTNILADQNLSVSSVAIEGDVAVVDLRGTMMLVGVCQDAVFTAQILHTIFENSSVNSAQVMVEGQNLKQIMDASGLVMPEDSVYTRAETIQP